VAHESPLYADRRTSLVEPSSVAVPQRVPPNGALNLGTRRRSLEHLLPERARIVRFVRPWARKNPVSGRLWSETPPFQQNGCDVWIQGNSSREHSDFSFVTSLRAYPSRTSMTRRSKSIRFHRSPSPR
jgi:hypothetical protein